MEAQQFMGLYWGYNLVRSGQLYACARVCECVCAHWVNIYEEAVVFLIWREPMHVVQQHRVSVEKVRVGDEDRRVWRYSTTQKQREARQWKYVYTDKRGQSWLTLAATADIQEAGLSAGTEAFIGGVIGSVGKQGFRSNKAVKRDTLHLARALVNQLQRSVKGGG